MENAFECFFSFPKSLQNSQVSRHDNVSFQLMVATQHLKNNSYKFEKRTCGHVDLYQTQYRYHLNWTMEWGGFRWPGHA